MIYQCDTCCRTTFEVNCPLCSGVLPVKTSAWGSASSTAQAIDIQRRDCNLNCVIACF